MAKPRMKAVASFRLNVDVLERLEDCADAEGRELADLLREILGRASHYRLNKLRKEGKALPPRAYNKKT